MRTAPPPAANPQPARRSRGYMWLGLTATVASVFGLGLGTALRFRVVPTVGESRFSPDQSFPPLADWPPEVPLTDRSTREPFDRGRDIAPQRRLLPAAEAATVGPADDAVDSAAPADTVPVRPARPVPSAESDLTDLRSELAADGASDETNDEINDRTTDGVRPSLQESSPEAEGGGAVPDSRQNDGPTAAPTAPLRPAAPSLSEPGLPSPALPDKSRPTPLPTAPAPTTAAPTPNPESSDGE